MRAGDVERRRHPTDPVGSYRPAWDTRSRTSRSCPSLALPCRGGGATGAVVDSDY